MTSFATSSRAGALVLAAALAFASCGASDDVDGTSAAPVTDEGAVATVDESSSSPAPTTPVGAAVLEVSDSLAIDGKPLVELPREGDDAGIGAMAPTITGKAFDGADLSIGGPSDGPTMLVFLAHWCPHCNDEIPEILKLRDRGDIPEELTIIGISTAVAEDRDNYPPSEWIVEKNWSWPVLADTIEAEAFLTYGGSGFPYTVMLNPDGTVAARKAGNESADGIKSWIDVALAN